MTASRAAGHPVTLPKTASIADGLLSIRPGDLTFAHVQALVDDVVTVSDDEIAAAVKWLFDNANVVAEPSGAVSVAAVLRDEACRRRRGRRHLWRKRSHRGLREIHQRDSAIRAMSRAAVLLRCLPRRT